MARLAPLVLLALALVACGSPKDDLDQLCAASEAVLQDPSIAPEDRERTLSQRFEPESSEMRNAWDALAQASRDQRWELLKAAADEVGYADWECPVLEAYWDAPVPAPAD